MKIRIIGILGICFVVLKLIGYIDWSWFYVTMPFWGGLAIGIGLVLLGLFGIGVGVGISGAKGLIRKK